MLRRDLRGVALITALAIASILLIWSVAAVARVRYQSAATLDSYQKSQAYYLAKTAVSRSLNALNADPNWGGDHDSKETADKATSGALCWLDTSGGKSVLRCEATVDNKVQRINVPLLEQGPGDTELFSVTDSGDGRELIAKTDTEAGKWEGLPPIPGGLDILGVAATPSGDVFAVANGVEKGVLWRYRLGQGWRRMPDVPDEAELLSISAGGDQRIAGLANDNTIRIFI